MSKIIMLSLAAGLVGVIYSLATAAWIMKQNSGTDKMRADFRCGAKRAQRRFSSANT